MNPVLSLRAVKTLHTVVWAFFAGCIIALPIAAWRGDFSLAAVLTAAVFAEVFVLIANGRRCPLTSVAARFTSDRRANFDIYLPEWLARHNQRIFGWLFAGGLAYAVGRWFGWVG